eukprot:scaffold5150_cov133-Skeletonema_menzelii.AAC.12
MGGSELGSFVSFVVSFPFWGAKKEGEKKEESSCCLPASCPPPCCEIAIKSPNASKAQSKRSRTKALSIVQKCRDHYLDFVIILIISFIMLRTSPCLFPIEHHPWEGDHQLDKKNKRLRGIVEIVKNSVDQ